MGEVATLLQFGALGLLGYMIYLFHVHIEREGRAMEELRSKMYEQVIQRLEDIRSKLSLDRHAIVMALEAIKTCLLAAEGIPNEVRNCAVEQLTRAVYILAKGSNCNAEEKETSRASSE
ncbi:MAG: hypothetical protein RML36_15305 [Anaerolineae bacterium]|nr:hypothetical protein [Anaerolineae bacterium]